MSVPQISIFLDASGNVRAEAAGLNGSRRKIDLSADAPWLDILDDLRAQQSRQREAEAAKLRRLQAENIQYVAQNHNVDFAKKIWHNGELVFARSLARKRLEKASEENGRKAATKVKGPVDLTLAINIDTEI